MDDYYSGGQDKKIKVYKNGDPMSKCVEIKLIQQIKISNIRQIVQQKLDIRGITDFRLFNVQGVEIFDDDLEFIKNNTVLYASRGEEFDANSTFSEYDITKELGEGGFGKVLLGTHKQTQQKAAIKIIKTSMIGNAQDIDMVFREAEIVRSLVHKNIIKIMNVYTLSSMQVVFIMEFLEGGELLQQVEINGKLSEEKCKIYFKQIVDAMSYCHKNKLIHRDLKLENLLLVRKDSTDIKVIDFGIAGVASKINIENLDAGSLRYMAPEVLKGTMKQLTPAIDIWSMGVILYVMLFGEMPFSGNTNKSTADKIICQELELPKEKNQLSQECINLLRKLLEKIPENRISAHECLSHP